MNNINEDTKIIRKKKNNIDIVLAKTKKYSTVIFTIYFLQNYTEQSKYIPFLSEILSKCNNVHPTIEEHLQYLYNLYGTGVYASRFNNYKTVGISFNLDIINQNIVDETTLYKKGFEALRDTIYQPHTYQNQKGETLFDEKDLREVKNNAINSCINEANDKRRYANYRFLKKMTKKDEFPLIYKNTITYIKSLKNKDLYDYYQSMLVNSKIIVSAIGDIDESVLDELVDSLQLQGKDIQLEFEDNNTLMDVSATRITEKAEIRQAHINMGYRTDIQYRHELYPAYVLFNIMFGELPSSTLFSTIREEQGLAYTVYSSINPIRNNLTIYAGVDNNKIELAIKSIKKQLSIYQNGEILKENRDYYEALLEATKNELKNEYYNAFDNQAGVMIQCVKETITTRRNLKQLYEDSLKVTLEEIVSSSNHLTLDTTYVLKGESKNE